MQCDQTACSIDLDKNGRFAPALKLDIDRDGKLNPNPLAGGDDRRAIIEHGNKGLRIMSKHSIAVFYSDFTDGTANNVLPFPSVVSERHAGYVRDVTNVCDEVGKWSHCRNQKRGVAAFFRGLSSDDGGIEVRFPTHFCPEFTSGLSVSVRAKPLLLPPPEMPAVLFDSDHVRLLLDTSQDDPAWVAEIPTPGAEPVHLILYDPDALGKWTRLTFTAARKTGVATLVLRRRTTILQVGGKVTLPIGPMCWLSLGASRAAATNFMGFLDDPMLITGPVKEL